MNLTETLNEITSLSVVARPGKFSGSDVALAERQKEERIRIVQVIWDSIAAEQVYPDLTEAQQQELDRRIADYEVNPSNVLTWEEIKTSSSLSIVNG